MDALLANYGSEEEGSEDEQPQQSGSSGRIAASDQPVKTDFSARSTLFTKLPPPKATFEPRAETGLKSSLFSSLPLPKTHGGKDLLRGEASATVPRSSNTRSHHPSPHPSSRVQKRVVEFHLPMRTGVGSEGEGEEDTWRPPKKQATTTEREDKMESRTAAKGTGGGGLFAILPAPKHSMGGGGAAASLGGGLGRGSGRMALDLSSSTDCHANDSSNGELHLAQPSSAAQELGQQAKHEEEEEGTFGTAASHLVDEFEGRAVGSYDNGSYAVREGDGFVAAYDGQVSEQHAPPGVVGGWGYGNHQEGVGAEYRSYGGGGGGAGGSGRQVWGGGVTNPAEVSGALAKALAEDEERMRRKGRGRDAAPQFVEVKQANLIGGGTMREDKTRLTGIAFGPAHEAAAAAAKEKKPDKMHRRKHQIGSLYYDMRQRELELLERRAKGMMSKAETQAKYGW